MIAEATAAAAFATAWRRAPSGVAFAPGRVNLVGEHIDYHGGPVLPAALERGVSVAFAPRGDARVRARTVTPDGEDLHPPVAFAVGPDPAPEPGGDWANYVRAAALAAADPGVHAPGSPVAGESRTRRPVGDPARLPPGDAPVGADLLVLSDLPEASGLSSSSALVVAVGLALLAAAEQLGRLDVVRRRRLAAHFARAERFTGTEGGGMDQAASLGGVEGHALRITFDPLDWRPVRVPPEVALVVAHSGVRAEKSGAAQAAYNRIRAGASDPVIAAHNATERERVDAFVAGLEALPGVGDAGAPGGIGVQRLRDLGALMDASHASLRDRLGVSHPALERLVEAARGAGAAGARLTGAGFGGSMVALVPAERVDEVTSALRRVQATLEGDPAPAFIARPGAGARILSAE